MKSPLILYVEDENVLAEIVRENLEDNGYRILHATTGSAAFDLFTADRPDLIILDVMLPDMEGFQLAKQIREIDQSTPIIFLSSKSLPENVVSGFESGGNDYLKKPFSIKELLIRVKSLLSGGRIATVTSTTTQHAGFGKYNFDMDKGLLVCGDKIKQLTSRETEILKKLFLNKNKVITRAELLNSMWGNEDFFTGRSLDVFITKLRNYLKEDPSVQIINIRGVGYKLVY